MGRASWRLVGAALVLAGALVGVWSTSSCVLAGAVDGVTSSSTTTTVPGVDPRNPFASGPLRAFLLGRTGTVTMAVEDLSTGLVYSWHDHVRQVTASMAKIDILAALLDKCQRTRRDLNASERALAMVMVEDSDNAAAQLLWNDLGGYGLIPRMSGTGGTLVARAFNARIGFVDTYTDWGWSQLDTTPVDYLKLLKVIALPNAVLSDASRSYEKTLMEHVISSQRFGIPNGVPGNVEVGVKNGWYPESDTGWQVNSSGYVLGTSTRYLAVIMTGHNPSEGYGMATVNGAGAALWRFMSAAG